MAVLILRGDPAYVEGGENVVPEAQVQAAVRVRRGYDYLQRHHPGWYRHINLDPAYFDMASDRCCIWGQLAQRALVEWFGPVAERQYAPPIGYSDCLQYMRAQALVPASDALDLSWTQAHGFAASVWDGSHVTYAVLQEQWRPRIRALQEADPTCPG
jgi:hypothetical protein